MPLLALLVACWPAPHVPHGPIGMLASRVFWLGGLVSAALWALAFGIAFG